MRHDWIVELGEGADRLDRALSRASGGAFTEERAKQLIESGAVFVDGRRVKAAARLVRPGARLVLHEPEGATSSPPPAALTILYQDERILVLDKPPGEHLNETETSAREAIIERLRPANRDLHVVHRLDRGTSGVVVLARGKEVAEELSRAFRERAVKKEYLAIVEGSVPDGAIDAPIGLDRRRPRARAVHAAGKPARTEVRTIGARYGLSLLRLSPLTGRTHQIRVHLAHAGAPIVGDRLYGGPLVVRLGDEIVRVERPLLHAERLVIPTPDGERTFVAEPPPDLARFVSALAPG